MTTAKAFVIKVNGEEIETEHQKLPAREILELAKEHGAIPGKPEDYILKGEKREYGLDDTVDLAEDNIFIAVLSGPTPVA